MNKPGKKVEIMRATDFDEYLAERLKDKKFKEEFDACGRQLELAYSILQLRKSKNISQADLADKVGTTQSNIARAEGGSGNFTIKFLDKIAKALDCRLEISIK